MAHGQGEVRCCILCGRDTKSRSQVCWNCTGGRVPFATDEMRGRKTRRPGADADGGFEPAGDDKHDPSSIEEYHGESLRDDL
jgi:hypothetical protein